ncbi:MAG: hypothetical protein HY677_05270 [Chloroflexi bacterium]|nr:hypothetical protein [Chloroflexota bacterium]
MFLTIGTVILIAIAAIAIALARSGVTDSPKPVSRLKTEDYHSLVMASDNQDILFFGHHEGVLRSPDGGETWRAVAGLRADAMSLVASEQSPKIIYLAGHEVLMKSLDGGSTWQNLANNLPGLDLHWFAVNPDDHNKLYASAVGFGFFSSGDGGATWARWNPRLPAGASLTTMAILGREPLRMLAGTKEGRLLYSEDGGASWQERGELGSGVTAFALKRDTKTIYAGTTNGVYRSEDARSWMRLPLETTVAALAVGREEPAHVVVVSNKGNVFRSDDGGQTW